MSDTFNLNLYFSHVFKYLLRCSNIIKFIEFINKLLIKKDFFKIFLQRCSLIFIKIKKLNTIEQISLNFKENFK